MSKSKLMPATQAQARADHGHVNDETLRGFLGYHIKRASNLIQADLAETLVPIGLRMTTFTALVLIVDNPGLRQTQLADAMTIERPNLVVILDELERNDLIVRERVITDRRAYALNPTAAGRQLFVKANALVARHEKLLLQGLNSEARNAVIVASTLIRENSAQR